MYIDDNNTRGGDLSVDRKHNNTRGDLSVDRNHNNTRGGGDLNVSLMYIETATFTEGILVLT